MHVGNSSLDYLFILGVVFKCLFIFKLSISLFTLISASDELTHAFFFLKQRQELCLSIKTNEVYIQAKVTNRGVKHHERLAHPRNAVEYTLP